MKYVLIRLFSTITILALLVIPSFGQTVSRVEFEDIVDEMICDFTDLSLKEQRNQPHYQSFQNDIQLNCDYYSVRPFLRELDPPPAQTLEIVNMLHHQYKPRYNSKATNQRLHDILAGVFDENVVSAFSRSNANSFPAFKSDWQEELRERFMLDKPQEEAVINDTLPATTIEIEYNDIVEEEPTIIENKAEDPNQFITDPNEELKPSGGLGNSFLFFGFLLLFIALALFWFLYKKNKGTIDKGLAKAKAIVPTPKPKSKVEKKNWLSSTPKKETYAEKIAKFQMLIQTQKNTLVDVKNDIYDMHQQINQLTEKAGFEVIDEHIKQLSQKLDEVEQKQKELILVLDNEQIEISEKDDIDYFDTETAVESVDVTQPEKVTESNFSNEIPVIQIKKLTSPPDLFFMPVPNKDGSFDTENWTAKFEDTESVYRFEMINHYEAKFQFHNDAKTVKRAISGYDIYVKPVCKALNAFDTNATEIKTQVEGVVYRDGDVWKLKEKALIYYQ